jgi:hypothetical protein
MDTSYLGMSHYARTVLELLTRSQKTLNQTISVLAKTKGRIVTTQLACLAVTL